MPSIETPLTGFDQMHLAQPLCAALEAIGYHTPTPIQLRTIPHLIQGRDLLGQARTGTGKTAAFALPLLSGIDLTRRRPQILVMTPTRELAIQVAASFDTYGQKMKGLKTLCIYGGQSYGIQLSALKRGVHVVVGTPGRLMDHLQRKTLDLSALSCVVLDEADEMLHMGFIEDVQWILDKTPDTAQKALFSATMPGPIRKISRRYLNRPEEVLIGSDPKTLSPITQRFWMVRGMAKTHALSRILDALTFDGIIVFTRTRTATTTVAKHLEEKGYRAEALNGDMVQSARERVIDRLKTGRIDILVATDVAARGLDVDRISHVINYDMPGKVDPYIHRIGRTGRAGRTGEAILFVSRNERWILKKIEQTTRQKIREMQLPSNREINRKRTDRFKAAITETLSTEDVSVFQELIESYAGEQEIPVVQVAAALARLSNGTAEFLLPVREETQSRLHSKKKSAGESGSTLTPGNRHRKAEPHTPDQKSPRPAAGKNNGPADAHTATDTASNFRRGKTGGPGRNGKSPSDRRGPAPLEKGMDRYRIEVGQQHGVNPRDIVGAIANEAGLEGKYIGNININPAFSLVDLPVGMPRSVFRQLKKTWVRSRQMAISKCA